MKMVTTALEEQLLHRGREGARFNGKSIAELVDEPGNSAVEHPSAQIFLRQGAQRKLDRVFGHEELVFADLALSAMPVGIQNGGMGTGAFGQKHVTKNRPDGSLKGDLLQCVPI